MRISTSGAQRYSSGWRSNASESASVSSSFAASSYQARAWPISVCAMAEKATSSSRNGAMPVHSELRQPRMSSSSASLRSSCAFTCLLELHLERVAVHPAVVAVEDVSHVRLADFPNGVARDYLEGERLVAVSVELARVGLGEDEVRRLEGAAVLER